MLNKNFIIEAAQRHHEAEKTRQPMRAFSQDNPAVTLDDAYAIQEAWVNIKCSEGRKVIGRKVGLTSRAMQDAMKISEPDFGTLLDDMYFENGASIPAADYIDPRIEVEITFVLKSNLFGGNLSVDDVLSATDYVVASMELIAARSHRIDPETGYKRTVFDTISDNAANAGIIVGSKRINPAEIDLRWAGAILYRNGIVEETGLGAGILGHPANGVVWLAKRFAPHNIKLDAGQFIMSGSFTRPVIARAGDHFKADFGQMGTVELSFT